MNKLAAEKQDERKALKLFSSKPAYSAAEGKRMENEARQLSAARGESKAELEHRLADIRSRIPTMKKAEGVTPALTAAALMGLSASQQHKRLQMMQSPQNFQDFMRVNYPSARSFSPYEVGMRTAQNVFLNTLMQQQLAAQQQGR